MVFRRRPRSSRLTPCPRPVLRRPVVGDPDRNSTGGPRVIDHRVAGHLAAVNHGLDHRGSDDGSANIGNVAGHQGPVDNRSAGHDQGSGHHGNQTADHRTTNNRTTNNRAARHQTADHKAANRPRPTGGVGKRGF